MKKGSWALRGLVLVLLVGLIVSISSLDKVEKLQSKVIEENNTRVLSILKAYQDLGVTSPLDDAVIKLKKDGTLVYVATYPNTTIELLAFEKDGKVDIVYPTSEVLHTYSKVLTHVTR